MTAGAPVGNTSEKTTLLTSQLTNPPLPLRVRQILSKEKWLPNETKEINRWRVSTGLKPLMKKTMKMPPKQQVQKNVVNKVVTEAERRLQQSQRDKAAAKGKEKVQKSLVKSGAKNAMGSCDNRYLCQLLDPEQYGPSPYPDNFGDQTTTALFIYNSDVPIDSDSGEFGIVVNPTLPDHVKFLENVSASTAFVYRFNYNWTGNPINPGADNMLIGTGLTEVQFGRGIGKIFKSDDPDQTLQVDNAWIYLPEYTNGTLSITVAVSPGLNSLGTFSATSGTITCSVHGSDGSDTNIPTGATTVLPNGLTKIKIRLASSQGPVYLLAFPGNQTTFTLNFTTAASVTQNWVPHAVANYSNLLGSDDVQAVYTTYRTVALTALITYKGDTLYDGGTIAGRYMEGGSTAFDQGYIDYNSLATARGSYDGASKKGAYAWWKPRDAVHMAFRSVETNNDEGYFPHLVFFGKITTSTISAAKLRLRVAMVLEAATTTMFVPVEFSRVAVWEIEAADMAIQMIPRIMENPLHVEAIRNFLRGVLKKGREITASVKPHLPAIMKLAATAAPLLGL